MKESFDKLQILMKSKVDKVVSDKLDLFYYKEIDDEREEILFNYDGSYILSKAYHIFDDDTKEYLEKSDKKCFLIGINTSNTITNWCYKKIIVHVDNCYSSNNITYSVYKHNFTISELFILKYFSLFVENSPIFQKGIDLITEHPDNYEELKKTIDYIFINKISEVHIKNYFNYLFTQANDFINKNS